MLAEADGNEIAGHAQWRNPEDVKASHPKASILKSSRVVFNIKTQRATYFSLCSGRHPVDANDRACCIDFQICLVTDSCKGNPTSSPQSKFNDAGKILSGSASLRMLRKLPNRTAEWSRSPKPDWAISYARSG